MAAKGGTALALAKLSASYLLRRPLATLAGTPPALKPAMLPACAVWSAALAATGAAAAFQVGVRVRRAPILRPFPALLASHGELADACSLVSDTHLVAPDAIPVELVHEPQQWPFGAPPTGRDLAVRLADVLREIHRRAPSTVVWCGDEVDSGDPREWQAWREVAELVPGLAHRFVPGNHDICFNQPLAEDHTLARRAVRERAYQEVAGALADFPITDTIVTEAGPATLVLLDSCQHRSRHVLSNAIGRFGPAQLYELARLLERTRGPVLVVAHHHVWRDRRFLEPQSWFETAVDADQLVAILGAYRRRDPAHHVLICHGHRHVLAAGLVGERGAELAVFGMPSTTLGDKSTGGVLDGVPRYAVAGLRRDGSWGVAVHVARPSRTASATVIGAS